jgi:hypothetical protein
LEQKGGSAMAASTGMITFIVKKGDLTQHQLRDNSDLLWLLISLEV